MRYWRRIKDHRFQRSELYFVASMAGLAFLVGIAGPTKNIAAQLLIVLWAGLVGMMIPRIIEAHRDKPETGTSPSGSAGLHTPTMRHDMASALLTIEGGVTALRYMHTGEESPRVESIAHAIEKEIRRIRRLSLLNQPTSPRCKVISSITPLIELHKANGAAIQLDSDDDASVTIAADDLARAVANILDNCQQHAPNASVSVSGYTVGSKYRIVIHDDGPGIDDGLIDTAWQRGISSRPDGGLGLYSVRSIIETCGGSVSIDLTQPGTTIQFDLPVAAAAPGAASVQDADGPPEGSFGTYQRAG